MITADLEGLHAEALNLIESASDRRSLDDIRVRFLGKKGELTGLLKQLGQLPHEERREAGQAVNRSKQALDQA